MNAVDHIAMDISRTRLKYLALDKKYTMSEYRSLSRKLRTTFRDPFIDNAINLFVLNTCHNLNRSPSISPTSFSFWLESNDSEAFQILYGLDLEDMPLYLNDTPTVAIIAAWRLRIGK
jgi:hypothetical protein